LSASTVIAVRLVQPSNARSDAGDAVGIVTLVRLVHLIERPSPMLVTVGDRDAGQAGAAIERIVPDAGDAVGIVTLVRLVHS
jgi:hypothetical protein